MVALTLLKNAEVYGPARLGRRDLLVAGGAIVAIEERIDGGALPACEIVDIAGARVVPGLVDAHVHLTGGGGESGPASRVPPVLLSSLTRAGITAVVGTLGTDVTTRTMEALVATALGLRAEGLSAYCWTGGYEVPPRTLTSSVRSDIVFVDPILGVGETALSDHRSSQPSFEEIARLAADCHVAGMMSGKAGVLHLHLGDGPRGLSLVRRALDETELPPSTFHPTHVNRNPRLFEEALSIALRGVPVDVTAFPVEEDDEAIPAEEAIVRYLASGAPTEHLTCSSDGGGCLPSFDGHGRITKMDVGRPSALADTLAALVARGVALEKALPVFTRNVADVLRLPQKGRIECGADADLVVLDDDACVRDVMARGRFFVRGGVPVVTGTFERSESKRASP